MWKSRGVCGIRGGCRNHANEPELGFHSAEYFKKKESIMELMICAALATLMAACVTSAAMTTVAATQRKQSGRRHR